MKKNFRRLLALLAAFSLLCTFALAAGTESTGSSKGITVTVDGVAMTANEDLGSPFIYQNRTLVPLRAVAYALGMSEEDVVWDSATRTASFTQDAITVSFTMKSDICTVKTAEGTTEVRMDVTLQTRGGRIYAPARYLAEGLGYTVTWSSATRTAAIYTGKETAPGEGGVVKTSSGLVAGTATETDGVAAYLGIPYAAAPVGDLRWKAPQEADSWDGIRLCDSFGPCSYQEWPNYTYPWMAPYTEELEPVEGVDTISEDCLYLNIWTNATSADEKLPVIIYYHGGGNTTGSGSIGAYGGEFFAAQDAIYVTVNYRLGVFGFLSMDELDAESETGTSGNYAIMDCIAAAKWVKENIAAFGGDPDNITISGQSAGGLDVEYMTLSDLADGVFDNMAVFSGNMINATRKPTLSTHEDALKTFRDAYPDASLEEMRQMSTEEIFSTYTTYTSSQVDGYVITEQAMDTMSKEEHQASDLLLSCVEGDVFSFATVLGFDPANGGWQVEGNAYYKINTLAEYQQWLTDTYGDQADAVAALYPASTDEEAVAQYHQVGIDQYMMALYIYARVEATDCGKDAYLCFYKHAMAGDEDYMYNYRAFHTSDIPYWNGMIMRYRSDYTTDVDAATSQTMMAYLRNFIGNDDPNGEGLNEWSAVKAGSCSYMMIGDDSYELVTMDQDIYDFWLDYVSANIDFTLD